MIHRTVGVKWRLWCVKSDIWDNKQAVKAWNHHLLVHSILLCNGLFSSGTLIPNRISKSKLSAPMQPWQSTYKKTCICNFNPQWNRNRSIRSQVYFVKQDYRANQTVKLRTTLDKFQMTQLSCFVELFPDVYGKPKVLKQLKTYISPQFFHFYLLAQQKLACKWENCTSPDE